MIADGAEWIWNAAAEQFPGTAACSTSSTPANTWRRRQTSSTARGPPRAGAWFEATRRALLGDGWYGVQEQIGRTLAGPISDAGRTAALEALTRYLAAHSTRLNYRLRLARGEPIPAAG